jgi:DNA-directed RNA polymerase specialized sigma24 family protein
MRIERKIEKFYAAWSPSVLALCFLLAGEGADAERTTGQAFHAYLSRGLELDVWQLPALLLIYALDAAKRNAPATPLEAKETPRLQEAIVLLPWKERAVFALRSAMGFEDMTIGEVVEIPVQEVLRIWMKALFRLRELLPKEFFQGRKT